ncbi:MFS transporter, partial [Mesorhizobium sp. M1C.F.Ca.ET.187.01.1.1]
VGAALGPIIGGWLLQHFWWGSVFLINVPVVVMALVATLLLAPEGQRDSSRPWDLVSSVLALAALSGLVLAIKSLIATPPSYALGARALLLAVITGAAF